MIVAVITVMVTHHKYALKIFNLSDRVIRHKKDLTYQTARIELLETAVTLA